MEGKRCFFIGHRDVGTDIYFQLVEEVEKHIVQYGVREFYVGHYGRFDSMAAQAVAEVKDRHKDVRLILLLPFHPAIRPIEMSAIFDESYFPEGQEKVPVKAAILRANEYMVQRVDFLICYVDHPSSGSRAIMEKALSRQKQGKIQVTNIADCNK